MNKHHHLNLSRVALLALGALIVASTLCAAPPARAQSAADAAPEQAPATETVPAPPTPSADHRYRLGAHAELDVGALIFLSLTLTGRA